MKFLSYELKRKIGFNFLISKKEYDYTNSSATDEHPTLLTESLYSRVSKIEVTDKCVNVSSTKLHPRKSVNVCTCIFLEQLTSLINAALVFILSLKIAAIYAF